MVAIHQLSPFLDNPMMSHYHAATRLLKYLRGFGGGGLFFPAHSVLQLKALSDLQCRRLITENVILDDSLILKT